ncbi:DsbE family thiol:disulfide interchange protein [Flocculibacter collagenilyticus]|uniref:DsbE family thiol:disulfide interchange protein n=1 Tax=Flocculibacter collagenilyticus TaxID=2744479 RepID=UPI0018F6523E|nr:DsbE family thiol:disulfide interchange protein [Flocculibacter collagenilyticus]
MNKKLAFFLLPFFIFLTLTFFLLKGLFSDPRERESALIGKPLPEFQLIDLMEPNKVWTDKELLGEPVLLNVWAEWCPTCNEELGFLTELRERGVKIVGVYYLNDIDPDFGDKVDLPRIQAVVQEKLTNRGNPYQYNMLDTHRSLILDLGVDGAPETFFIDAKGVIRFHHKGDINQRNWRTKFADIYRELDETSIATINTTNASL